MGRAELQPVKKAISFNYSATATSRYFHSSKARVKGILGPIGSSKSVTCCMEMFSKAMAELPGPDGVRKTRWLVVRSTFPELKTTTIKTFMEWFGDMGTLTFDSPIRYHAVLPLADGTTLDWEVWFKPIDGSQDSLDSLRSLEITGAFLNEAHEFPPEVYDLLRGRVGRFRPHKQQDPAWDGLILDSNYGNSASPLRDYVMNAPEGWEFFEQPPAVLWDNALSKWVVNERAENIEHLPGGLNYYRFQLTGMKEHNIRQLLACQWATPRSSKPVYPEFNSRAHVYKGRMQPDPTLPLVIGIDFGLHAAATFGQMTKLGGLRILDEVWDDDIDLESFLDKAITPKLHKDYRGLRVEVCGDPAGQGRSALDKRTPFMVLKAKGFSAVPAPSNALVLRRDAMKGFMERIDGLIVNPQCERLIEGMSGAFGYKRMADGSYSNEVMKNVHSHIAESAEYLAMYVRTPAYSRNQPRAKGTLGKVKEFFYG